MRTLLLSAILFSFVISGCSSLQHRTQIESKSVWVGSYMCLQGKTDLAVEIMENSPSNMQAIFRFHYAPENVRGSYYLSGSYDAKTRFMKLVPGEWIQQPSNYVVVGMEGNLSEDLTQYTGSISHPLCGSFDLKLTKEI